MSNRTEVEILTPVKEFLDSKCINSQDSYKTYLSGLVKINDFLSPKYTAESILKPLQQGEEDVYRILGGFLKSQSGQLSIKSIRLNLAIMKSYFGYHDIDIVPLKFKKKITLPKLCREDEAAIDASDVRKILLACNNRRLKSYCLVLASCGCRAVEGLSIRNKDIDFNLSPAKIHLRKEFTKTRVARDIYVSNEATGYLKDWIDWKYRNGRQRNDSDLVFGVGQSENPRELYTEICEAFGKILDLAGFSERKDDSIRHKVTLHSFRRLVKTVISDQVNQDYSEWFLGHTKSSYWTKKEPAKREIYATKCMKYLTFLDYTTLEVTGKNIEAKLQEKDSEMQAIKTKYEQDMKAMREDMNQQFNHIMSMIQENPKLAQVKPEVLTRRAA